MSDDPQDPGRDDGRRAAGDEPTEPGERGTPPPPPGGGQPGATSPPPPPPTAGADVSGRGGGPPAPPPRPPAPAGASARISAEARNWALAAHISAFATFLGVPWFVGPLVVWLVKRNDDPFIDEHGKESVNFSLSVLIYGVGLAVIGAAVTILTLGAAIILVIALAAALVLGWFVLVILASVKAANGERYQYPLTLRLVQ